jgi:hypothetical protein
MFGFFLSIGMIVMLLYVLVPQAEQAMGKIVAATGVDFLIGTTMMMCLSVLGARIVVGFPTPVKANWIFQVTQRFPRGICEGVTAHIADNGSCSSVSVVAAAHHVGWHKLGYSYSFVRARVGWTDTGECGDAELTQTTLCMLMEPS